MKKINNRQIVLDTETTGLNTVDSEVHHRIIEIGAVEIINRHLTGNNFHVYLKPNRLVDPEAFIIHGISDEFLFDKPQFFNVVDEFLDYIRGAELVMHNAAFDIDFINYEVSLLKRNINKIETFCQITDSLAIARKIFPGKRNSLDALCIRYEIDNSKRTLHGALLDAEILAEVYLAMTGGQTLLAFSLEDESLTFQVNNYIKPIKRPKSDLCIVNANKQEIIEHENLLDIVQKNNGKCIWRNFKY
ncbi:DNA polymerase III subunit epsilon [Pantoea sp. Aalb]|uniref:DNA polymerase III subunit epsilon n=1 Tax=Pantoea sp. Aalb TaxID=2576762 RepID=UPI001326A24E|nr:DNA polymerase III subunit epsilon [Pantoea sp. Aalb]MXP67608.1 DNA polymerase III subunit epsilon [Pantoea sp. Aalb]